MNTSPDIDQGWAYVVSIGYFYTRAVVIGIAWSPGMLYHDFIEYFEGPLALTAWTLNINTCVMYVAASISSALIKAHGPRLTMVIGCCFSTVGILVTSFAPSLSVVFITYGILTGIGFSMINVASYQIITSYFCEYQVLVLLLAGSGGGVGTFIFPLLFFWLRNQFSWKGALWILSGLNLNILVVAAVSMSPRMEPSEIEEYEYQYQSPQLSSEVRKPHRRSVLNTVFSWFKTYLKMYLLDDLILFHNYCYVLVVLSYILIPMGHIGMITLLKALLQSNGLTELEATTMLSLVGLFSLLGTGMITLLTRTLHVNILIINVLFFIGTGVGTIILGMMGSKIGSFITVSFIGFFSGALDALPVIILTIVGIDDIAAGIGYACIGFGIGCVAGGPIGAALYNHYSSSLSFVTLGAISICGASLQIPVLFAMRRVCNRVWNKAPDQ